MPYAIEYESEITGNVDVGPVLRKKIEKCLFPVKFKNMTKAEAEEFCENVNLDSTYENAFHRVVEV